MVIFDFFKINWMVIFDFILSSTTVDPMEDDIDEVIVDDSESETEEETPDNMAT